MTIRGKRSKRRAIVQVIAAVAANSGVGALKLCPYPGLNCYACPLASFACPMGSLQNFLVLRRFPFAMAGFFTSIGAVFGRAVCGWACPFGFVQDLLAAIGPRRKRLRTNRGGFLRYIVLIGLAVTGAFAVGSPLFCKLCPAGTRTAGIPQVVLRPSLRQMTGPLYWVKISLLAALAATALFVKRPFCRFLCPLGAVYSPFNRISLMRMHVNNAACTRCGACRRVCPVDIAVFEDPNSDACVRCLECTRCPAVTVKFVPDAPVAPVVRVASEYPPLSARD